MDVLNTVQHILEEGNELHLIADGVNPSTKEGRLQLGLFAMLAEYERELINERVRAGVHAAQARGVKFGKQPPKPEIVENKVETVRWLMSQGKTAKEAAETVNWSRATLYRYLKRFGEQAPASDEFVKEPSRSRYAEKKTLPARTARGAGG